MLSPDTMAAVPLWLSEKWTDSTVFVSSEVKISRNLSGWSFPGVLSQPDRRLVAEQVSRALSGVGYEQTDLERASSLERTVLKERRIISKMLAAGQSGSILMRPAAEQEAMTVSTNDGDHVRIRSIGPGSAIRRLVEEAMTTERLLATSLKFAKSSAFGYLTTLYRESGSGMRLSLILHLPALVVAGQMEPMISAVVRGGIMCSGCFGDESMGTGNLFHFYCEPGCLSATEEAINSLEAAAGKVAAAELAVRLPGRDADALDTVARAHGILASAVKIDFDEAICNISLLSLVRRFGLGPFDPDRARPLFAAVMPGHLHMAFPEKKDLDELRDRADLIRSRLWGKNQLALD